MFEAADLRRLIDAAGAPLKAMILLAINAGLGNSDIGNVEFRHVDTRRSWLNYPRPKTGIDRRCPLWPETRRAIDAAIADRPEPKIDEFRDLIFITRIGGSWSKNVADSPVSKEFAKLLAATKLRRPGLSFYAIRHTFATIAGESGDLVAASFIMGHVPASSDMSAVYRERMSDSRLDAVSDHVRRWLLAKPRKAK